MKVAYADPPYPGMAKKYKNHPDYAGEVDHAALFQELLEYDAWVLHTASTTLQEVLLICPVRPRLGAWVKTFTGLKHATHAAYAWEPVLLYGGRNRRSEDIASVVDWIACPIMIKKGLTGAKPPEVVRWVFRVLGLLPDDELTDMFPGIGIVLRTWETWRTQPTIHLPERPAREAIEGV